MTIEEMKAIKVIKVKNNVKKQLLVGCMLSVLILSACAEKTADEEAIKSDIMGYKGTIVLDDGESLDEVTIRDRNTDKKSGVDRVICSITSHDSEKSFVKEAIVLYKLDDEKNWVLEDITVDSRSNWRIMPVAAPSDDLIKDSLSGQIINADGEEWGITEGNLADATVKEHDTDFESGKDTVKVSVTVNDVVEKLNADLTLNFAFDDGWKLTGIEKVDNINVETKSGMDNTVGNDQLIGLITAEKMKFGSGDSNQKISADKSELTGFEIIDTQVSEKGTKQVYKCSFDLDKSDADFFVDTTVEYNYVQESGWVANITEQSVSVTAVDIEGTWAGETLWFSNKVTLEISKDENNKYTGTYKYNDKYGEYEGEYEVSGRFNEDTFKLELDAGDWVTEPKKYAKDKENIELVLFIDDEILKGQGHGDYPLTLKRVE